MTTQQDQAPHLSQEEVAAFLDGGLGVTERTRVERHLADCQPCREEVVAVSELLPAPVPQERGAGARSRSRRRQLLVSAALAAAIGGILMVGPQTARSPAPIYRSAPLEEGARTLRASAGDELDLSEPVFRWEAAGEGALYQFVLLASDGEVLWSTRTREDRVRLPESVARTMVDGERYYWRTDALLGDLSSATTGEQPFRVSR